MTIIKIIRGSSMTTLVSCLLGSVHPISILVQSVGCSFDERFINFLYFFVFFLCVSRWRLNEEYHKKVP